MRVQASRDRRRILHQWHLPLRINLCAAGARFRQQQYPCRTLQGAKPSRLQHWPTRPSPLPRIDEIPWMSRINMHFPLIFCPLRSLIRLDMIGLLHAPRCLSVGRCRSTSWISDKDSVVPTVRVGRSLCLHIHRSIPNSRFSPVHHRRVHDCATPRPRQICCLRSVLALQTSFCQVLHASSHGYTWLAYSNFSRG
jgi:hypothetical protein